VQLYQDDIPLINGKEYILELDARADAPRTINVELERAGLPWTSYSKHGQSYITSQFSHIEHSFRMEEPNDLHAKLVINGGGYDIDFEVKNISVRQLVVAGILQKERPESGLLCYPNSVSKELHISFQLESASTILLQLFTLSGQVVETIYQGKQIPGHHEIIYDTGKLAEGAYMLHLKNGHITNSSMLLVQH
jgi:hypothetical protein